MQEGGDGGGGGEEAAVGGDYPLSHGPPHTRHVQEQI